MIKVKINIKRLTYHDKAALNLGCKMQRMNTCMRVSLKLYNGVNKHVKNWSITMKPENRALLFYGRFVFLSVLHNWTRNHYLVCSSYQYRLFGGIYVYACLLFPFSKRNQLLISLTIFKFDLCLGFRIYINIQIRLSRYYLSYLPLDVSMKNRI